MTKYYAAAVALLFVTPGAFAGHGAALTESCCAALEACCEQVMDCCDD